MRRIPLKLGVVPLLACGLTTVYAQEGITASGGNALGSGGSESYSVGQVFYVATTGTTGSVSPGVQRAYEITVETGIDAAKGIVLSVSAYPNPTTDYLTLSVSEFEYSNLAYQLYDAEGRILQTEKISGSQTTIAMSGLVSATYFVKVVQECNEVKMFKIIKN